MKNQINDLEISLISHASILIKVDDIQILTDPWFFGTAFNDGWELNPTPNLDLIKSRIADVNIIWISHEHPDHLHFPTLKWLSENLNDKPSIYFQKNNSGKVFDALKKFGYEVFVDMPHMKKLDVSKRVKIACYAHRQLDSSLGVFVDDQFWLLNINDTELNQKDTSLINKYFGNPSVIYNQFSIAGSTGIEEDLKNDASNVLHKMIDHHKELKAKLTVPFASYVKFARSDNNYMNKYSNNPLDVKKRFGNEDLEFCLQSYNAGPLKWKSINDLPINIEKINIDSTKEMDFNTNELDDNYSYESVQKDNAKKLIEKKINIWRNSTNKIVWKLLNLGKLKFSISDWDDEVWECDFKKGIFTRSAKEDNPDIYIASQPLAYAFQMPFGIQTLGVSGRYKFAENHIQVPSTWKKVRVISSLFNAEIHLNLKSMLSKNTLKWIWERRIGLFSQVIQQIKRFIS